MRRMRRPPPIIPTPTATPTPSADRPDDDAGGGLTPPRLHRSDAPAMVSTSSLFTPAMSTPLPSVPSRMPVSALPMLERRKYASIDPSRRSGEEHPAAPPQRIVMVAFVSDAFKARSSSCSTAVNAHARGIFPLKMSARKSVLIVRFRMLSRTSFNSSGTSSASWSAASSMMITSSISIPSLTPPAPSKNTEIATLSASGFSLLPIVKTLPSV